MRQRAGVEERRGEIAVRRGVHAVVDDAREAEIASEGRNVDGVAGAGNRAAAERTGIRLVARAGQPREIAPQRRRVRQEEVRHQHRLGRPEVRERRHQRVARRCRLRRERIHHRRDRPLEQRNPPAQVETQIERDLFVARAARVQALAGVADSLDQLAFDEAVDVFVRTPRRTTDRCVPARGSPSSAASI